MSSHWLPAVHLSWKDAAALMLLDCRSSGAAFSVAKAVARRVVLLVRRLHLRRCGGICGAAAEVWGRCRWCGGVYVVAPAERKADWRRRHGVGGVGGV